VAAATEIIFGTTRSLGRNPVGRGPAQTECRRKGNKFIKLFCKIFFSNSLSTFGRDIVRKLAPEYSSASSRRNMLPRFYSTAAAPQGNEFSHLEEFSVWIYVRRSGIINGRPTMFLFELQFGLKKCRVEVELCRCRLYNSYSQAVNGNVLLQPRVRGLMMWKSS